MAQTYPLDRVIRKVEARIEPQSDAQKCVIVDAKKREPVTKKPFLRDVLYYLVSNADDIGNVADSEVPPFPLRDLEHGAYISVKYQASCPSGNECQLAKSLFDFAASPNEVLDRLITKWLNELVNHDLPRFITKYFQDKNELETKISEIASRETGLLLKVKLFLDAEQSFNPLRVVKEHLPVLVSDYHEEQDLTLQVELEVDEANKTNAILHYHRNLSLHQIVPQQIQMYIRRHMTMQQFCTELSEPKIKKAILDFLNASLKNAGRKVSSIFLDATPPAGLEFFVQDQQDVVCEVQNYPTPVILNNKVQMTLTDVAKYGASKSPNPKTWLKKSLDRIIPEELFDKKYIDLLIAFSPIEERIKGKLSAEAAAIGYEIKQLITVPNLVARTWKDNFQIVTEETYETKLSKVYVNLKIVVTARINDLAQEGIQEFLNNQQDIPALMKEDISSITRQYLHKIEPERFYMHFNFADDGGKSVEDELISEIKDKLKKKFCTNFIDVVLKVGVTDIIARLRKLQETTSAFAVTINSLTGGEGVVFRGQFKVVAVDANGWPKFQWSNDSIEEMTRDVEEHILSRLHTVPSALLRYTRLDDQEEIVRWITAFATEHMRDRFGLGIELSNIRRDQTVIESRMNDAILGRDTARIQLDQKHLEDKVTALTAVNEERVLQLTQLLNRRTTLTGNEGAEEELADLDQKIKEMQSQIEASLIPEIEDVQRRVLPGLEKRASLKMLAQQLGLPGRLDEQKDRSGSSGEDE